MHHYSIVFINIVSTMVDNNWMWVQICLKSSSWTLYKMITCCQFAIWLELSVKLLEMAFLYMYHDTLNCPCSITWNYIIVTDRQTVNQWANHNPWLDYSFWGADLIGNEEIPKSVSSAGGDLQATTKTTTAQISALLPKQNLNAPPRDQGSQKFAHSLTCTGH